MTVPSVLFSIETWVLKQKRLFFTNCCRNLLFKVRQRLYFHTEDIRQELNVTPISANIDNYRKG